MDIKLKQTDKIEFLPIDRIITIQNGFFSIADTTYNIKDFEIEEVLNDSN